ncbi:MAG: bifunctional (p)ppGpp synthetase/guanosine-3',5'-bis(diphosphate) 3'-pyrophosphohydrolase [Xanthomonadales bacterium]|nr:bifunctional (p)ppGpp synthetase/guanosine-3',5'-bis(diphosphate) 3'-pyrophosphohydrolase [Xanthomonadales bacterium]
MKQQARQFAIESHGEQRYGEHPYAVHLDAVAHIAEPFGENAVTVAYLHDVVEDTEVSLSQIKELFGSLVASCVAILTDEPGDSRKERKAKTYEKMSQVSGETELALIVKVCDRLANVKACVADNNTRLLNVYQQEQATFRSAVYRPGLCDDLWHELEAAFNDASND